MKTLIMQKNKQEEPIVKTAKQLRAYLAEKCGLTENQVYCHKTRGGFGDVVVIWSNLDYELVTETFKKGYSGLTQEELDGLIEKIKKD